MLKKLLTILICMTILSGYLDFPSNSLDSVEAAIPSGSYYVVHSFTGYSASDFTDISLNTSNSRELYSGEGFEAYDNYVKYISSGATVTNGTSCTTVWVWYTVYGWIDQVQRLGWTPDGSVNRTAFTTGTISASNMCQNSASSAAMPGSNIIRGSGTLNDPYFLGASATPTPTPTPTPASVTWNGEGYVNRTRYETHSVSAHSGSENSPTNASVFSLSSRPTIGQYVSYTTPTSSGIACYVSGYQSTCTYSVYEVFYGYVTAIDDVRHEFTVSQSMSTPEPSPYMGSVPNLSTASREWGNEIYSATPQGGSPSSRQWYYKASSSDGWHSFTNNSAYYTPSAAEVGYSYQVYYSATSGYQGSGYSSALGPITKRNVEGLEAYKPVPTSTTTTVGYFPEANVSLFLLTIKPVFNTDTKTLPIGKPHNSVCLLTRVFRPQNPSNPSLIS